jgi:hypothetical protein
LVRKPEGKRPLRTPRCRWDDIKMILGKKNGKVWTVFIWLRKGPVADSCEDSNETSGSIKGGVFLE